MTWVSKAGRVRAAALAVAIVAVFLPAAWARGQHGGGGHGEQHFSGQRSRAENRAQNQGRPQRQFRSGGPSQGGNRRLQDRGRGIAGPRPFRSAPGFAPSSPGDGFRPAYPGPANGRPPYFASPAPPYYNPRYAPPGHLEDWLNRHRGLPLRDQEQLLRSDPSFSRLPAANQRQLIRQLQDVDKMSPQQREWRLARAEAIEHMSPLARQRLDLSSRNFATLPPQRRAMVKRAFRELRSVPLDERQTVLNSERYRGMFTPEERQILSAFLSVEPYLPPR